MKTPRRFSSDPVKSERNAALRDLPFATAEAFSFETAIAAIDHRKDYGEVRQVAIGFIERRLHVLVFTMRYETCHVISLRKANRREIRTYVEKTEELE